MHTPNPPTPPYMPPFLSLHFFKCYQRHLPLRIKIQELSVSSPCLPPKSCQSHLWVVILLISAATCYAPFPCPRWPSHTKIHVVSTGGLVFPYLQGCLYEDWVPLPDPRLPTLPCHGLLGASPLTLAHKLWSLPSLLPHSSLPTLYTHFIHAMYAWFLYIDSSF